MTQTEIHTLEKLSKEYDEKHGASKADEISGALMQSHSLADQIKVFKKAKGREIILEVDTDSLDGILITYK